MAIYAIVLLTVLTHTSFKGSKVLISLYALDLGASPLTVGVLFSMYSVFPVLLAVYAGKLSDRFGSRRLILFGASGLAAPWPSSRSRMSGERAALAIAPASALTVSRGVAAGAKIPYQTTTSTPLMPDSLSVAGERGREPWFRVKRA
jgi:MFS family permease